MHGDHPDQAMRVKDLIELLSRMPPEAEVLYRCCSDWSPLSEDEVTLTRAEDRKIVYRTANGYSDFNERFLPKGTDPATCDFRTCVLFPGN